VDTGGWQGERERADCGLREERGWGGRAVGVCVCPPVLLALLDEFLQREGALRLDLILRGGQSTLVACCASVHACFCVSGCHGGLAH
jgi:hypothetical protein